MVVAYNLEGAPGNEIYIDVYDPNDQFTSEENSNGARHEGNVLNSRIHMGSDGEWSLPSTGLNGAAEGSS